MTGDSHGRQKAHTDWLDDIAETRQLVREALMELRRGRLPADRAVLAHNDHNGVVATAHAGVLDLRDLVEPWGARLTRWSQADLGTCTIYHSSEDATAALAAGGSSRRPESEIDALLPSETGQLVGLDKLDRFEGRRITYWRQVASGIGRNVYEPTQAQMYMPPAVAARAFRQLNSCLNELDLAAAASPPPEDDGDKDPKKQYRELLGDNGGGA